MKLLLLLTVSILGFSAHAGESAPDACSNPFETPAQTPCQRYVKVLLKDGVLFIDGKIDSAIWDYVQWEIEYRRHEVHTIELNSYGGRVEYGVLLADWVRKRQVRTRLRQNAFCASACVSIYAAGIERVAHPTARLGLHGVRPAYNLIDTFIFNCVTEHPDTGQPVLRRNRPECMAQVESWTTSLTEETKKYFEKIESFGVAPQLQIAFWRRPEDPFWFTYGNFIRIQDWELDAPTAASYQLIHKIENP